MPPLIFTILLAVFPALVIVAALRDMTTMTIPNWVSLALIAAFAPAAFAAGLSLQDAALCVGVGIGALALGFLLFALRWIGGGDAKLFASASLWLGAPGAVPFLVWTALAGGVLALLLLGLRQAVAMHGFIVRPAWLARLLTPGGDIPYGIAIAAGALAAFTQSPLTERLIVLTP